MTCIKYDLKNTQLNFLFGNRAAILQVTYHSLDHTNLVYSWGT